MKLSSISQLIIVASLSLTAVTAAGTQTHSRKLQFIDSNHSTLNKLIPNKTDSLMHTPVQFNRLSTIPKSNPKTKSEVKRSSLSNFKTLNMSPPTKKQLQAIHQMLIDQATTLQSNGIDMAAWGPDEKTGKELIEVVNLTADEEDYLNSQFGAENIDVRNVTSRPMLFGNYSK